MEMKRTKGVQAGPIILAPKRGKIVYPQFYKQWAGFLPFPPQDCPYAERIFTDPDSKVQWLDLAFCASGKCGRSPCPRRREYTHAEWKAEYERLRSLEQRTQIRRTR